MAHEPEDELATFQRWCAESDARIHAHAAWFAHATRQAALDDAQRRARHLKWRLIGTFVIGTLAVSAYVLALMAIPWLTDLPLIVQQILSSITGIVGALSGMGIGEWFASKRER